MARKQNDDLLIEDELAAAFLNDDSQPDDDHNHGTQCASIAAATGHNATQLAGVDWQCRIMPLKVLDAANSGLYSDWADAIDYAVANGAHVISLSAGGSTSSSTLSNAIMRAISNGVVFCTITHNDSTGTIRFPGRMRPAITVGATTTNDTKASYSNWGAEIDLVAPGSAIQILGRTGSVTSGNGTSYACPQVAATACLLLAIRPELSHGEVRALLCAAADDRVGAPAQDTAGFDVYHGWGRLNAYGSLLLASLAASEFGRTTGGLSLAWTAPPNASNRAPFRVLEGVPTATGLALAVASGAFSYTTQSVIWTSSGLPSSGLGFLVPVAQDP